MLELLYQDGELSKKYLKKGEKLAKENLGAVKGRIDKAFFSKAKSASQEHKPSSKSVIDTSKMDDFLKFSDEEDEENEETQPTKQPVNSRASSKRPSFSTSFSSKKIETQSLALEENPSPDLADFHSPERPSNPARAIHETEFESPKQTGRNLMNEYEKNVIPPKEISLNEDEMLQMLAEAENDEAKEANELTETEISQLLEMDIEGGASTASKSTPRTNEKPQSKPNVTIQSTENEEDFDSLIEEINEGWDSHPHTIHRVQSQRIRLAALRQPHDRRSQNRKRSHSILLDRSLRGQSPRSGKALSLRANPCHDRIQQRLRHRGGRSASFVHSSREKVGGIADSDQGSPGGSAEYSPQGRSGHEKRDDAERDKEIRVRNRGNSRRSRMKRPEIEK